MSIKIATLGTCTSENWYHFQKARERLDVDVLHFQPSSIISLMAEPVDMSVDPGTELSAIDASRMQTDFDKSFLLKLIEFRPDILIVELLADTRKGVIRVGDSWVTNSHRIEDSPMRERLGFPEPLTACSQPEEYLRILMHYVRKFADFLKKELPECRIVLHRARWAEYFIDESDQLQSYPPWKQNSYFISNARLAVLDDLFKQEVDCEEIDVDDVPNFADIRHIWGPAADHYIKAYYASFTVQIRLILESHTRLREPA